MTSIVQIFDRAISASQDRSKRRGQVARINASGAPTIDVPGTNGRLIYVRLGDGSDGTIEAVPKGVPRRAHTYVKVFQEDGQWVAELDTSAIAQNGAGSAPVAPHTHRRGSGNEYVMEAELFAPGLVLPSSGLVVSIASFRYPNSANGETYPGGTLDLTSVMPVTAGTWAWIVVGINPATNTAVAVAGAEFASQSLLTIAEIDNVAFTGYIPLAAIQASQADTSLNNISRYYDARTWFTPSNLTDQGLFVRIDAANWIDLTDGGDTLLHIHDSRYHTEAEVNFLVDTVNDALIAHGLLTAAHGATGAVVGTTGAQTISEKTLTDPLIGRVYGGAGSGDDLILESTSDATKGDVLIQPNGGNVGIGIDPPAVLFHVFKNADALVEGLRFENPNAGTSSRIMVRLVSDSGVANSATFQKLGANFPGRGNEFNIANNEGDIRLTTDGADILITDAGLAGIGPQLALAPAAQWHVDQASTTAAVPVLLLAQSDLSEEMIQFNATVGAGNPVDTAALGTYYGKIRVSVNGTFKYIPLYNS